MPTLPSDPTTRIVKGASTPIDGIRIPLPFGKKRGSLSREAWPWQQSLTPPEASVWLLGGELFESALGGWHPHRYRLQK